MKKLFIVLAILVAMLVAVNTNAQWEQISNGMGSNAAIYSFTSIGTTIFVGTIEGIYKSTNDGINWTQTGLNNKQVFCLTTLGNNIFAGTGDSGVYISTNNGTNWSKTALNNKQVYCLATLGSNLFAGIIDWSIPSSGGIYRSTNNGSNWTYTTMNSSVASFTTLGTNIFAGTDSNSTGSGKIYLSTNSGLNWSQTSYNSRAVWSLTTIENNIFAGTYAYGNTPTGVYLSTNLGANWIQTSSNNRNTISLTTIGSDIITGIYDFNNSCGVYLSTNNGGIWINKNQGFNVPPMVRSFLVTSNFIFAGTESNSIWRRSLSEIIGIQNISTEIPFSYSLSQNYPNPFNPTTNIKFSIIKTEQVKLIVYNVQGRQVQALVNERLQPGTYETSFDGSLLNSGVYFYKLITDGFTETKKMLLIK
ncbi:MAG: T9SS type A sorting domain-containing protein [Candidatus Kapaibacterium sp.]